MGQIYFDQDDCSKALEYYEKSLNIYLMIYGENASWGIANVDVYKRQSCSDKDKWQNKEKRSHRFNY